MKLIQRIDSICWLETYKINQVELSAMIIRLLAFVAEDIVILVGDCIHVLGHRLCLYVLVCHAYVVDWPYLCWCFTKEFIGTGDLRVRLFDLDRL